MDCCRLYTTKGKNVNIGHRSLAVCPVTIEFFGKPAHAAAWPDRGINALEAMILTFSGINALRQHLRDDVRIHGIITHGGDAPNIVPHYAAAKFGVRAADTPYATELLEKLRACAEGAPRATGARLEFKQSGPRYDARRPNPELVTLFRDNMAALGLEMGLATGNERMGSSDTGNVSQVVPAIHPYISIGPEFREAAGSVAGHKGLIRAAKALAMTAVDLLAEPANLHQARQAFREQQEGARN